MAYDTLSKEQMKSIETVGGELARAATAAHDQLVAVGLDPDATPCTVPACTCDGYRFGGGGGACKTNGCHHSILRHANTT